MKFKQLPAGKVGMIVDDGNLYGRTVANIAGKYFILDKWEHLFVPAHSTLTNLSVRKVGDYKEDDCSTK